MGGERPTRTAVRRTPSRKGLGVDVSAFAGGKVTETESLEKEATALETVNVLGREARRDKAFHKEAVEATLRAKKREEVVGKGQF